MTPTKELRDKLDELGVEYVSIGGITNWEHAEFDELADGSDTRLIVYGATPEQAIAATVGERNPDGLPIGLTVSNDGNLLNWMGENYVRQDAATVGAGTCHNVGDKRDFCCSECGVRMFIESDDTYTMIASDERTIIKRPKFCPNCGARVR